MPSNPDSAHHIQDPEMGPEKLTLQPSHPKEVRSKDAEGAKSKNRFASGRCPQQSEEKASEQRNK